MFTEADRLTEFLMDLYTREAVISYYLIRGKIFVKKNSFCTFLQIPFITARHNKMCVSIEYIEMYTTRGHCAYILCSKLLRMSTFALCSIYNKSKLSRSLLSNEDKGRKH